MTTHDQQPRCICVQAADVCTAAITIITTWITTITTTRDGYSG